MRYIFFSLFLFALAFTSCGADSAATEKAAMAAAEAAQTKAYETMMEAHDRIMPMMGNITATQRSIKEALQQENLAPDRKELLEAGYEQLEDAGDQMMAWMSEIKPLDKLRETMDNDGIMAYVKEQAGSIGEVETAMTAAIASGKELLGDTHTHEHDGHDHDGHGHDHGHSHDDHSHSH